MNLSMSIMLVNDSVRPVKVEYDPDTARNNSPNKFFKTLDPTLVVGDLVIVPTNTRHGFTIVKVLEVGFRVDFQVSEQWSWVAGKLDKKAYDSILEQEKIVVDRIGKAEEDRIRAQLRDSMQLGNISFTDLDVVKGTVLPAPSSPRGQGEVTPPAPQPAPKTSRYEDDGPL
jgi:hypothetical protein